MAWVYLALASVFEVGFALSMKASKGFTLFWPSVATVVGVVGAIGLMSIALRTLPVSVAYPIWVGAGALGAVVFGYAVFGETLSLLKIASVVLFALGIVGLKISALV